MAYNPNLGVANTSALGTALGGTGSGGASSMSIGHAGGSGLSQQDLLNSMMQARVMQGAAQQAKWPDYSGNLRSKVSRYEQIYKECQYPTAIIKCIHPIPGSWYFQVRVFQVGTDKEVPDDRWAMYSNIGEINPPGLRAVALAATGHYEGLIRTVAGSRGQFVNPQTPQFMEKEEGVEACVYQQDSLDVVVAVTLTGEKWSSVITTKENQEST